MTGPTRRDCQPSAGGCDRRCREPGHRGWSHALRQPRRPRACSWMMSSRLEDHAQRSRPRSLRSTKAPQVRSGITLQAASLWVGRSSPYIPACAGEPPLGMTRTQLLELSAGLLLLGGAVGAALIHTHWLLPYASVEPTSEVHLSPSLVHLRTPVVFRVVDPRSLVHVTHHPPVVAFLSLGGGRAWQSLIAVTPDADRPCPHPASEDRFDQVFDQNRLRPGFGIRVVRPPE
jgi:hypothetical protein